MVRCGVRGAGKAGARCGRGPARARKELSGAVGALVIGVLTAALSGCGPTSTPGGGAVDSPSPSPAAGLAQDVLLTAGEMPAWNGAMGWAEASPPAGEQVLAVCGLAAPDALGAVQVLARTFEAAGADDPGTTPDPTWPRSYGINEVALFASEADAAAAVDAWEAALQDCAGSTRIGALPTGSTWTAAEPDPSACPDCQRFEFVGVAAQGAVTTLVGFALSGQDANYDGDPLAEAMSASVARCATVQEPQPNGADSTTPSEQDLIRRALVAKTGIPEGEMVASVAQSTGRVARGTVSRAGEEDGGLFLAARDTQGVWVVTFVGNGVPDCADVEPYGYPAGWVDACMRDGVTVWR